MASFFYHLVCSLLPGLSFFYAVNFGRQSMYCLLLSNVQIFALIGEKSGGSV